MVFLFALSLYPAGQVYAVQVALVVQQAVALLAPLVPAAVFFHALILVVPDPYMYSVPAQVTELPPHFVVSASQHVDAVRESCSRAVGAQLAASLVQSVVATPSFILYPAGHVAAEHLALTLQQSATLEAAAVTLAFHVSSACDPDGKYVVATPVQSEESIPIPPHVSASGSQHPRVPREALQVDTSPEHFVAALAVTFLYPAGHV